MTKSLAARWLVFAGLLCPLTITGFCAFAMPIVPSSQAQKVADGPVPWPPSGLIVQGAVPWPGAGFDGPVPWPKLANGV